MILRRTRSFLALYGRPSMIFCDKASPMPGSWLNSSFEAVLMSSLALLLVLLAAASVLALFFDLLDFADVWLELSLALPAACAYPRLAIMSNAINSERCLVTFMNGSPP